MAPTSSTSLSVEDGMFSVSSIPPSPAVTVYDVLGRNVIEFTFGWDVGDAVGLGLELVVLDGVAVGSGDGA